MRKLPYRAQSWAADRFRGIQYPREVQDVGAPQWKYAMPLYLRIAYVLLFGAMVLIGAAVLAFVAFMAYGLLR